MVWSYRGWYATWYFLENSLTIFTLQKFPNRIKQLTYRSRNLPSALFNRLL